jgi:hypothetical protein
MRQALARVLISNRVDFNAEEGCYGRCDDPHLMARAMRDLSLLTPSCQHGRVILHCIIDSDLPKLQLFNEF